MGKVEEESARLRTVMVKARSEARRCLRVGLPTLPLAWFSVC